MRPKTKIEHLSSRANLPATTPEMILTGEHQASSIEHTGDTLLKLRHQHDILEGQMFAYFNGNMGTPCADTSMGLLGDHNGNAEASPEHNTFSARDMDCKSNIEEGHARPSRGVWKTLRSTIKRKTSTLFSEKSKTIAIWDYLKRQDTASSLVSSQRVTGKKTALVTPKDPPITLKAAPVTPKTALVTTKDPPVHLAVDTSHNRLHGLDLPDDSSDNLAHNVGNTRRHGLNLPREDVVLEGHRVANNLASLPLGRDVTKLTLFTPHPADIEAMQKHADKTLIGPDFTASGAVSLRDIIDRSRGHLQRKSVVFDLFPGQIC